jgi:UDP-3-O-[3-hydroxymyristoyl] glucosamine N-acyltransferase
VATTLEKPKMSKTTDLSHIARLIKGELIGDGNIPITGVKNIEQAEAGDITFLAHPKYKTHLDNTRAAAIIVSPDFKGIKKHHVVVDNPYVALSQVLEYFYGLPHVAIGVHPLAVIGKNPKLGERISIYPWAVLGNNVELSEEVTIYPGACVGDNVKIGANSVIHQNVSIYPGIIIGERVNIHSGSVIGSPGFGYVWDGEKHRHIPQVGSVVIEDEVDVGANVTIDRGTMGDTRIGRGTKIDNLVQIAHNVTIGEHSIVVAQVGVSGSTQIGHHVIMGGQAAVVGHIQIGDQVKVAARTGISKSVPSGAIMAGFAGVPHAEWRKSEVAVRRLPKLQTKVRELEKRLEALEEKEAKHK